MGQPVSQPASTHGLPMLAGGTSKGVLGRLATEVLESCARPSLHTDCGPAYSPQPGSKLLHCSTPQTGPACLSPDLLVGALALQQAVGQEARQLGAINWVVPRPAAARH